MSVIGPKGTLLASLTVYTAVDFNCNMNGCTDHPLVHLSDVPGVDSLYGSGPLVARSIAMNLTDFPDERAFYKWADNVRLVTFLGGNPGLPPATSDPQFLYGGAFIELDTASSNERVSRVIRFTSYKDFGTLQEAQTYAGSEEHQDIQAMIASFRESD